MALFGLFNREKKERLDQGLDRSRASFFGQLARAIAGKSKVDDEVFDALEETLVAGDVGVKVRPRSRHCHAGPNARRRMSVRTDDASRDSERRRRRTSWRRKRCRAVHDDANRARRQRPSRHARFDGGRPRRIHDDLALLDFTSGAGRG